jgi:cysteine-rich repeat protein
VPDDRCDNNCQLTGFFCGDGQVQSGLAEECDDGNRVADDHCSNDCELTGFYCGDGQVQPGLGERCDDANTALGDGCRPDCTTEGCGDAIVDPDEECDDGNSDNEDACLNNCRIACGDGRVSTSELCDVGIAAGDTGACPGDCDDADACTTDALDGTDCQAHCVYGDITATIDDDGCCPEGATSLNDNDCAVVCGNGAVESGETCDTAIAPGSPGDCPVMADCVDGLVCTSDVLANPGTCTAVCQNPDITTPMNGDGCCPAGATTATDSDCAGVCNDGIVTPPELCDTLIPAGMMGACPVMADCVDGMACTSDVLVAGGTCNAACSNPPITMFVDGDGCCPPGGNNNVDTDCPVVCGNSAVETGEQCDDGGTVPGDGCDAMCQLEATAFRFTDLDLRDPHVVVTFLCLDVTDTVIAGFSVNSELQNAITMDTDGDGLLELSPVAVMKPLDQGSMATTPMDFVFADCTAPMASTTCSLPMGATVVESTATNKGGTDVCLGTIPATTGGYSPAITVADAGMGAACFSSDSETLTIDISGIPITLTDARVAARYSGSPATGLVKGLVRGFISKADADVTILPDTLPVVGGETLSSVLPGGGSCPGTLDTGPGGVMGWYFYLNFTATVRPYSG